MAKASLTPRAHRAARPATTKALAGRIALFRGKVRGKPLSVTMTPRHWTFLDDAADRLALTRADVVGLLIEKDSRTLTLPTRLPTE